MERGRKKIGVIGAGIAFRELHMPRIAQFNEKLEVTAITARSEESTVAGRDLVINSTGDEPAVCGSVQEVLASEPDVVLLNVPITQTYELALEVLEAGIPLICEKPLGESAVEAEEVVQRAESRSLFLGVCENFRYQSRFGRVAQMVLDGVIGEPKAYLLNDFHYTPPNGQYSVTPWRQRGDHRGGYLLDGGSHIVAGLRSMTGETPTHVEAVPASFHPNHLGSPWDAALANLTFDSGMVGHLALGYGAPDREARHPKILGTEGTIALLKDRIEVWRPDADDDEAIELESTSDGIDEEWDDFVRALGEGAELRFSPWEAVADLLVLDAILESAEADGAPVEVRRLSKV